MARSSRLESGFQDNLKKEIEEMFPGCMVFKMDKIQGMRHSNVKRMQELLNDQIKNIMLGS